MGRNEVLFYLTLKGDCLLLSGAHRITGQLRARVARASRVRFVANNFGADTAVGVNFQK